MALKIVNLSKRYKDRWVLRDISFEVSPGEIFGIAGVAGAGKTSLLAAIAGSAPDNGGTFFYNGNEILRNDRRAWLYYSPYQNGRSAWWRVFGNPAEPVGPEMIQKLDEEMTKSEGVVLFDDPFTGVDVHDRDRIREIIASGRDRGLAIILACADFENVLAICDRAAILSNTVITQTDTPKDLYENPETRDVATATGRCNLFAARRLSSSKSEVPEFHSIDGGHRLFARSVERRSLGAINQNVTLGIRPEHISISFGASFPEDNLLRARITGVRFLGATTLVDLDCDGLSLQSIVLRLVGLNVGDECVVGLPPERVHIFRS
ncbi:MAG TPA: TOBE domain-containing protein [Pyrinomonadaceae bacterium]